MKASTGEDRLNYIISMTTSIKELSIAEPELHPTLIDLPSVTSIVLTVDQVDEKMGTMTPDVYSMCKTAT